MPNWKQAEDYEYTTSLNGDGWAWEFLRRSELYQADFRAALANGFVEEVHSLGDVSEPLVALAQEWQDTSVEELIAENLSEWLKGQAYNPAANETGEQIARKWGLRRLMSPESVPEGRKFLSYRKVAIAKENVAEFPYVEPGDYPRYAYLVVDLQRTVRSQLDEFASELEKLKSHLVSHAQLETSAQFKRRFDKYPAYLQILDGRKAGATIAEIATVMVGSGQYGGKDSDPDEMVKENFKSATKFVQGAYRTLLD